MQPLEARHDPFVTSLELAVESAGYRNVVKFQEAYDRNAWSLLTPAERAEAFVYGQALADNFRWGQMMLRHQSKTRQHYTDRDGWHRVEFTDAEKAAERRAFQERN